MSEPYETRTAQLGPFTLKIELSRDDDSSVTDWMCDFASKPKGIAYDRMQDVLIDADEQVYFEDMEIAMVEQWEEKDRDPRILEVQKQRTALWETLSIGERRMLDTGEWRWTYRTDAICVYLDLKDREDAIWKEEPPELSDAERAKYNDQGYKILPWPAAVSCPSARMERHSYRYINLANYSCGMAEWRRRETLEQAKNPEYESYPDEQNITWAAEDAARSVRWANDEWHFVNVDVSVVLDDEDDEPGTGLEIASDSLGGVESDSEEYIMECAHDMLQTLLSVSPDTADDVCVQRAINAGDWVAEVDARFKNLDWDIAYT